ncbi:MAG: hypothetical protein SFY66_11470 [Oculatellaceae cyanobacterium bins.114]|nr:hypothetical protein [Oculatellaceae cyanobacterium bins.114]
MLAQHNDASPLGIDALRRSPNTSYKMRFYLILISKSLLANDPDD